MATKAKKEIETDQIELEKAVEEKVEPKKEKPAVDPYEELVPFYAFKDSNKYRDDITVELNGKIWRIKRGVQVMIPRKIYLILADSLDQDARTADFITAESAKSDF